MQVFKYIFMFILPIVALSMPAPEPEAKLDLAAFGKLLTARQDQPPLGGLLGDLLGSLGSVKELLAPETLDAIKVVVTNAAKLLDDDGTKRAKALITNASELLTADLVKQLNGLLKELGPVISAVVKVISMLLQSLLG
ncbi:hypothetical protein AJ79_04572 [Helicocarpus griseus UAMH5409]|uniref:Uncharacterized protein n=1 Tax=Helicocarpus griseus UAMH5409 TaxID=1447875 RepID=A0A2B7XSQ5_9EURO|nr:hypothetical protein AJ79_04572 [Helicocarpus griseus UAMH5409]